MESKIQTFNLGLRGLMEAGVVLAFGYWGYWFGNSDRNENILDDSCSGTGFGFWGLVDFHQFDKASEILRLSEELIISLLAAYALFAAGVPISGYILAIISVLTIYWFMQQGKDC